MSASLNARWALATTLAAVGVLLLAGDGGASVDLTGVGLAVASGVGYATYTVLSKRTLDSGEAPEGVMAAGFGGAALLLAPVLGVVALGEHPSATAGAGALLVLAGLLVLAAPSRRRLVVAAVPA